ncbi:uncharacterized protein LOC128556245 [Mercenaria mercenaria]|uniref:uncharacterized protein LOC128556245 n=1 Tax=Mercenaria mercenaria TaxID=6596 RepID=UPI00234E97F5|nr:uncharacterized protein LOC128556245 [Mercenaria mercenaria]
MGEDFINRAANMNEMDTQELTRRLAEEHLVPDQLIEDLNCKAALLLIDKKYRQEDVEQAIQKAREKYGREELRVHFIHEFLNSNMVTTPRNIHAVAPSQQTNNTTVSNGLTEHQHLVRSRDFNSENLDTHDNFLIIAL